ncbi:MAG: hypothetical protein NVS4B3_03160 [Gemmatimonadaceae bacterium]
MKTRPPAPGDTRVIPWPLAIVAGCALLIALGLRTCVSSQRALLALRDRSTMTEGIVLERVRNVAKIVSTESGVRDVVTYENTHLGSTKKSLIVVTGRLLAGIDLAEGTEVHVDDKARRIRVTLPHARLLGVEVIELHTYDEQRGLWNPFRPSDRDEIYRRVREQLQRAGRDIRIEERAEQSAKQLLEGMFTTDGYVTSVTFRGVLSAAGDSARR